TLLEAADEREFLRIEISKPFPRAQRAHFARVLDRRGCSVGTQEVFLAACLRCPPRGSTPAPCPQLTREIAVCPRLIWRPPVMCMYYFNDRDEGGTALKDEKRRLSLNWQNGSAPSACFSSKTSGSSPWTWNRRAGSMASRTCA